MLIAFNYQHFLNIFGIISAQVEEVEHSGKPFFGAVLILRLQTWGLLLGICRNYSFFFSSSGVSLSWCFTLPKWDLQHEIYLRTLYFVQIILCCVDTGVFYVFWGLLVVLNALSEVWMQANKSWHSPRGGQLPTIHTPHFKAPTQKTEPSLKGHFFLQLKFLNSPQVAKALSSISALRYLQSIVLLSSKTLPVKYQ